MEAHLVLKELREARLLLKAFPPRTKEERYVIYPEGWAGEYSAGYSIGELLNAFRILEELGNCERIGSRKPVSIIGRSPVYIDNIPAISVEELRNIKALSLLGKRVELFGSLLDIEEHTRCSGELVLILKLAQSNIDCWIENPENMTAYGVLEEFASGLYEPPGDIC